MATHKAVGSAKRTGFDFNATLAAIMENFNSVVPGRAVGGRPAGPRKATAPITFNPYGRGAHAFKALTAAMEAFGGDGSKLKLEEVHEGLKALGYVPSYQGEKDKRVIIVSPVKGQAVSAGGSAGVDMSGYLAKMGIPGLPAKR